MNAQESHDFLLKKFDKSCRNYLFQNADKIEFEQALYDGAEALEKQIPKKLTVSEEIYCCPRCGENAAILQGDNYCFNCGQALDWSDTE